MKIYLISQSINNDYDTFDSVVVCAKNVKQARDIHPSGKWGKKKDEWWKNRSWINRENTNKVEVVYLGKAKARTKKGVVLASFNAG